MFEALKKTKTIVGVYHAIGIQVRTTMICTDILMSLLFQHNIQRSSQHDNKRCSIAEMAA